MESYNSEIFKMLFQKYQKLLLSKREFSAISGLSISTINRRIKFGHSIPEYIKESEGSMVLFKLTSIVDYLDNLPTIEIYK